MVFDDLYVRNRFLSLRIAGLDAFLGLTLEELNKAFNIEIYRRAHDTLTERKIISG